MSASRATPLPLEFFASPAKLALLTLGSSAMTAVSVLATSARPYFVVAGPIGCVFFGACALVAAVRLVRCSFARRTVVVFDEHGVRDERWRLGAVPWTTIRSLHVWKGRGGARFLCLELVDRERWLAAMTPLRRWLANANERLGAGTLAIGFVDVRPGIGAALAFLQAAHPELLPPEATPPRA